MPQSYLRIGDFHKASESGGGVTGSYAVQGNDGNKYQLKPSILFAKFLRRIKAKYTDRENFGEVIAAALCRALTGSDQDGAPELVPEVSLVWDDKKKEVLVASRYLTGVQGTIDEYAKGPRNVKTRKRHVKVSFTSDIKGTLYLGGEDDTDLRQDLAEALAVSILSGDHDVNPGNMMVVDEGGKPRMARIDFGHAFNDLLNAPKIVGGRVRNKGNQVLDFLNREELSNVIPGKRITKLWRDYHGIVPSAELAAAFKKMAEKDKVDIKRGLGNAKEQFSSLITDLQKDEIGNKKALNHIKKSLIAINNNVSPKISKTANIDKVLEETFKNLEAFYTMGQTQMAEAAKLMELQLNVDKFIQEPKNTDLQQEIQKTYGELTRVHGIARTKGKDGIEWIKYDKDSKAFKGSLEAFIKRRSKDLGKEMPELQELTKLPEPTVTSPEEKPLGEPTQNPSTIINPPKPLLGADNEYDIENIKFKYVQTAAPGVSDTQPKDPKLPVPTIDETIQFMQSLSPLGAEAQVGDLVKKAGSLKKRMDTESPKVQEEDPQFNADYAIFCAAAHTKVSEYHRNCSAYFESQLAKEGLSPEARHQFSEMRNIANHCAQVATNDADINTQIAIKWKAKAQEKLISQSPVEKEAKIIGGTVASLVRAANEREQDMRPISLRSRELGRGSSSHGLGL